MASKIDHVIMNGSSYEVWEPDMETILKSKGLWPYTKTVIPYPTNDQETLVINGKKDKAVGIIMTYISWKIHFHISGIDYLHQVWKNMKMLFDRVDERNFMKLEKELIFLNPHYFDKIEDYLVCLKEMQLKLGECGKNYQNKDKKFIELVLMKLRTPFNIFVSIFYTNW